MDVVTVRDYRFRPLLQTGGIRPTSVANGHRIDFYHIQILPELVVQLAGQALQFGFPQRDVLL